MTWIKDLKEIFSSLDIGLSRVLRYFYGGFLFVLLAGIVHDDFLKFAKTNIIVVVFIAIIVFVIPVLVIRSIIRNRRETQRLRMEVGKLADEVEQARKPKE